MSPPSKEVLAELVPEMFQDRDLMYDGMKSTTFIRDKKNVWGMPFLRKENHYSVCKKQFHGSTIYFLQNSYSQEQEAGAANEDNQEGWEVVEVWTKEEFMENFASIRNRYHLRQPKIITRDC